MRIPAAAAALVLLGGCVSLDAPRTIADSGRPAPDRRGPFEPRIEKRDAGKVERWTREQRRCEVADRDDQRRCVMPAPVD